MKKQIKRLWYLYKASCYEAWDAPDKMIPVILILGLLTVALLLLTVALFFGVPWPIFG